MCHVNGSQHTFICPQTTLQVLENETSSNSNAADAPLENTSRRLSTDVLPPKSNTTKSAAKTTAKVATAPDEVSKPTDSKSSSAALAASEAASSSCGPAPTSQDARTCRNGEADSSGAVSPSHDSVEASKMGSSSSEGHPAGNRSSEGTMPFPGKPSLSSGEMAPPSSPGRPAEEVAPHGSVSDSSDCKKTSSPNASISSSPTVNSVANYPNNEKMLTTTSSSSAKAPVVINHPIHVTSPSQEPTIPQTAEPVKSSTERTHDVRSHPVELTLPDIRSHPIQVPSLVEMTHPIEVEPSIRSSTVEGENRKPRSSRPER